LGHTFTPRDGAAVERNLAAANVKFLGAVLNTTFSIPETLYKKL